jgi:hypothetical protein
MGSLGDVFLRPRRVTWCCGFWCSAPVRGQCAFAPVPTIAAITPMKRVSDGSAWRNGYDN